MARRPRSDLPDGVYHATARCAVPDGAIVRDDHDRRAFVRRLLVVSRRFGWAVHAWCLMTTHYHLVVETTRESLSAGMREL